jgi:hypothetical protein
MEHSFTVSIGGVRLALDLAGFPPDLIASQRNFFRGFLTEDPPDIAVQILRTPVSPTRDLPSGFRPRAQAYLTDVYSRFPQGEDVAASVERALEWTGFLAGDARVRMRLAAADRAGLLEGVFAPFPTGLVFFDPDARRGTVFVNQAVDSREHASLLRHGVYLGASLGLAGRGGLLLHGAGAEDQGRGYAFLGLSGAGKSTLAGLSGPDRALSDDGICLYVRNRAFHVLATPFLQADFPLERRLALARTAPPLEALFFLKKGGPHRTEPRNPADSLADILHHYIHFFRWFPAPACRAAFATARDLVAAHEPRTLSFSRDAGFWDVIITDNT